MQSHSVPIKVSVVDIIFTWLIPGFTALFFWTQSWLARFA